MLLRSKNQVFEEIGAKLPFGFQITLDSRLSLFTRLNLHRASLLVSDYIYDNFQHSIVTIHSPTTETPDRILFIYLQSTYLEIPNCNATHFHIGISSKLRIQSSLVRAYISILMSVPIAKPKRTSP